MSVLFTVHCLVDEEPDFGAIPPERAASVRLSFSAKTEGGEPTLDEITTAVAGYRRFLDEAVRLHSGEKSAVQVFAFDGSVMFRLPENSYEVEYGAGDTTLSSDFRAWFEARIEQAAPPPVDGVQRRQGFISRSPGATDQIVMSEGELDAHHVLTAAGAWPAPLPHNLGLAFRVTVNDLPLEQLIVVVPCPGGLETGRDFDSRFQPRRVPRSATENYENAFDISYLNASEPPGADGEPPPFRTCQVIVNGPPGVGNTLVGPTGFIESGPDEEFAAAVRRIENRAGSLFTGHQAAAGVRWIEDPTFVGGSSGGGHLPLDENEKSEALLRYWLGCLAWQAAAMLATSFDTVLLALQMPGRHSDRDGQVLAPFLDTLVREKFAGPTPSAAQTDSEASLRKRLRRAIRDGLTNLVVNCNAWARLDDGNWLSIYFAEMTSGGSAGFASDLVSLALKPTTQAVVDLAAELRRTAKDTGRPLTLAHLAQKLATEMAPLHDGILSEAGCEKIVLRLFRSTEVEKSLIPDGNAETTAVYRQHVTTLETLFARGFNGAEAARQSVGSLIADLALHKVALHGPLSSRDDIKNTINEWTFWAERTRSGIFSPERSISGQLKNIRVFSIGRNPGQILESLGLKGFFGAAQEAASDAIDECAERIQFDALDDLFPHPDRRFVPDAVPQPIHLPITVDPFTDDDDGEDVFAFGLAGLGVLIREADEDWAHACLAVLHEPTDAQGVAGGLRRPAFVPPTIVPLPTTTIDGRRELFLTYSGDPFTSAAYGDSMSPTDGDPAAVPFFGVDFPDSDTDEFGGDVPRYRHVPALAYGRAYDFAVHIVGRAGTLPPALRGTEPWLPAVKVRVGPTEIAAQSIVSRRTAIGAARFENVPGSSRLGMQPAEVMPLSRDYRRVAVARDVVLDLFRNTDGSGAIALRMPETEGTWGDDVEIVLRDIRVRGTSAYAARIRIEVSASAKRDFGDDDCLTIEFDLPAGGAGDELEIHVGCLNGSSTGGGGTTWVRLRSHVEFAEADLHVDSSRSELAAAFHGLAVPAVWLRISVLSDHVVSFADPTPDRSGAAGAAQESRDDLLLLGSPESALPNLWNAPYGKAAVVEVVLPRMGLADFRRWTANDELRADALGLAALAEADRKKRNELFDRFLALLVALDIERFADPAAAERLDRLPDLAVTSVELSALVTDDCVTPPDEAPAGSGAARLPIEMPSLWTLLSDGENKTDIENNRIVQVLDSIDTSLRLRLRIEATMADPGDPDPVFSKGADPEDPDPAISKPVFRLAVPGGRVVRLSARSLVAERHFTSDPNVIHSGLRQLAVRSHPIGTAEHLAFEGPHVDIEAMMGPLSVDKRSPGSPDWKRTRADWAKDLYALVRHVPTDHSGTYRLSVTREAWDEEPGAAASWHWRRIGSIASAKQAWRFLGRPLHGTIDPRRHSKDDAKKGRGSLNLAENLDDAFFRFEDEAFGARDDFEPSDAPTRLQPIGHETTLVRVDPDPQKGASIFRHAFTLRSRYIGAMRVPERDGICRAWSDVVDQTDKEARAGRWFRVAVLAARPSDELNRPQLRALPPLTRRVEGDETISPPVLALLSETPFAFGGLAARIATEIRTGIGYGVVSPNGVGTPAIGPIDTRKEIGPDPRLSYRPMPADLAMRTVLDPEGPIGLSHDTDATSAPLFANTALLLHPRLRSPAPASKVGEENFLGVRTCRFLDPNWLVADERSPDLVPDKPTPIDPDGVARWIDLGSDLNIQMETGSDDDPVLVSILTTHEGTVQVDRVAIDPEAGHEPLLLCEGATALLVHPGAGRAATITAFTRGFGTTDMPVVLASVDITIPEKARLHLVAEGPKVEIRRTSASAPTAHEWVRTNPDFGFVTRHTGEPGGERLPVSGLVAVRTGNDVAFRKGEIETWIRASQSTVNRPTHGQRHMVCLFSQMLRGIGRDIERPLGAALLHGRTVTLPSGCETSDGLRFIEVETPAEFVGHPPQHMPDRYRSARFDLVATGADADDAPRRQLFRIRLLGPNPEFSDPGAEIRFALHLNDGAAAYEVVCSDLPKATCELIVSLGLIRGAETVSVKAVDTSGTVRDRPQSSRIVTMPNLSIDGRIHALTLKIREVRRQGGEDTHERWFEISLLSRLSPDPGADSDFGFDWIFGRVAPAAERIDDLDTLSAMKEAQARCIALSPRLPIAVT